MRMGFIDDIRAGKQGISSTTAAGYLIFGMNFKDPVQSSV